MIRVGHGYDVHRFAENRDLFLEDHHVEIHDIKWYKENKMIPEDYQVFWGFEDSKLYSMAKIELEKERIKLERLDIENKDSYNDKLVELKKKQIELEKAQMFDGNPYNDKVHD
mgnify:CR=1 FL=1